MPDLNLKIRKGILEDVEAIMELEQGSIVHPWEKKAIEALITDENKRCYVAESDGLITGYVGAELVLDEGNIGNIVTHKEYRGRGIASSLFDVLLDDLRSGGIKKLYLEVEHDNAPAIGLYGKLGFARDGVRRDYYGKGKDAVLMSLDL
jgi:ribosomal-protein-alanine N-acetyltransferase